MGRGEGCAFSCAIMDVNSGLASFRSANGRSDFEFELLGKIHFFNQEPIVKFVQSNLTPIAFPDAQTSQYNDTMSD